MKLPVLPSWVCPHLVPFADRLEASNLGVDGEHSPQFPETKAGFLPSELVTPKGNWLSAWTAPDGAKGCQK